MHPPQRKHLAVLLDGRDTEMNRERETRTTRHRDKTERGRVKGRRTGSRGGREIGVSIE